MMESATGKGYKTKPNEKIGVAFSPVFGRSAPVLLHSICLANTVMAVLQMLAIISVEYLQNLFLLGICRKR